ncbi:MAG: hypothetical protein ABSH36_03535 [Solirubrobacteraceae bacterium]
MSDIDPPNARVRSRVLAGAGLVLVVVVVVAIATDPFAGPAKATAGVADNASAISLTAVKQQSLSQQTQVSGTLGYAGSSSIRFKTRRPRPKHATWGVGSASRRGCAGT